MVGLRAVHALGVLPSDVAREAQRRDDKRHQVEDGRGEEARHYARILGREVEQGTDGGVDGDEDQPKGHAAWDGDKGPLRPDVGHQCGFAEDDAQYCRVQGGTPHPVPRYSSVALGKIPKPYELREDVGDERVVEPIQDPAEKRVHLEEDASLSELIKLWISIEQPSRNELVENAHRKRWTDGEEDVVKGQCPGFVDDLPGEPVL